MQLPMDFVTPTVLNEMPRRRDFRSVNKVTRTRAFRRAQLAYHRSRLSEAQNHKCCWCGCLMTDKRNKGNSSTIDHYVPASAGGPDHPDNYVIACDNDNQLRGHIPALIFYNMIQEASGDRGKLKRLARAWLRKDTYRQKLIEKGQIIWC